MRPMSLTGNRKSRLKTAAATAGVALAVLAATLTVAEDPGTAGAAPNIGGAGTTVTGGAGATETGGAGATATGGAGATVIQSTAPPTLAVPVASPPVTANPFAGGEGRPH